MTAHKRRCLTPLLVLQLDGPRRESRRRPRPNIADHLAPARPAAARPEEATAQRALAHAALCLHRPLLVGLERDLRDSSDAVMAILPILIPFQEGTPGG